MARVYGDGTRLGQATNIISPRASRGPIIDFASRSHPDDIEGQGPGGSSISGVLQSYPRPRSVGDGRDSVQLVSGGWYGSSRD